MVTWPTFGCKAVESHGSSIHKKPSTFIPLPCKLMEKKIHWKMVVISEKIKLLEFFFEGVINVFINVHIRYILKFSHPLYGWHTKGHFNFKPAYHGYIVQSFAKNGGRGRVNQTHRHGKLWTKYPCWKQFNISQKNWQCIASKICNSADNTEGFQVCQNIQSEANGRK